MLPIRVTGSASRQVQEAVEWWSANRTTAPLAFRDDLQQAFELISRQPEIGASATNVAVQDVRRVFLGRVRYFLYYRVQPGQIEILALWHSSRGQAPEI